MKEAEWDRGSALGWPGVIDAYRSFMPVPKDAEVITLGEGGTPLRFAPRLSSLKGVDVYLKFEGANPTGSFKDRGMTVAITMAKYNGARAVVCASTGNTSAASAAYAARAGLKSVVLIPSGYIALGKLAQALIYGAKVVQIKGNFDRALEIVRDLGETGVVTVVNSINPLRIEGQKTGAFEIVDALGAAPTHHFIPVGNAGNITAYWKGYGEYKSCGRSSSLPKMMGFQAEGAAPIVKGEVVPNPDTVATAIRIGNPASWNGAIAAASESGGSIDSVSDKEILAAYTYLAREESIFCEPASAASVAGLLKTDLPKGSTVVCVLTGNGLKDPDTAITQIEVPEAVEATLDAILTEAGI
ncbi:L-threonine synthase [Ferrithrix thermotolerans DSM 19514]|uniref:Threonine synthase n=1 Tax=Ferrithrix thermotolerans DSM 19514 TaxID=1121881 RepID=A0A1M4VB17_9ACTN|nr:threonine synthase [Ferrithrix thermotolerans]SHE66195.1 L-threonine synthase [Ferrithrix thermotolerans DSM 19514]